MSGQQTPMSLKQTFLGECWKIVFNHMCFTWLVVCSQIVKTKANRLIRYKRAVNLVPVYSDGQECIVFKPLNKGLNFPV